MNISDTGRLGLAPGAEPANKGRKYPAEPLTRTEADSLIAACSARSATGIRNRALIAILYRSGLRLAEVLALKPSDINQEGGSVRVLHGKGNRARTAGLDPAGMALVQRWIEARRAAGIRGGPLLCTLAGHPLSPVYVRNLLKRLAGGAGIEKRVHPHGLRHTHATELVREGVPVNVVSRQLGHSSSAVTARYIDHISNGEVVDIISRRTWTGQA